MFGGGGMLCGRQDEVGDSLLGANHRPAGNGTIRGLGGLPGLSSVENRHGVQLEEQCERELRVRNISVAN